jgi:hypothetical protein
MDDLVARIIERFGEEDVRDFVRLLDRFAEVAGEAVNKSGGIV